MEVIFQEFQGIRSDDDDYSGSGDVKYHLGTSSDIVYPSGKAVHVSLLPNPSHLETVNPVVVGKARAKMDAMNDKDGSSVLPIIIHGDAAFAGQGVVYVVFYLTRKNIRKIISIFNARITGTKRCRWRDFDTFIRVVQCILCATIKSDLRVIPRMLDRHLTPVISVRPFRLQYST